MNHTLLKKFDNLFSVKQEVFLNDNPNKHWLNDAGIIKGYAFGCKCNKLISLKDAPFTRIKHIDILKEAKISGYANFNAIIHCNNCLTYYTIAYGYIEPNNGRDVLYLGSIYEIDII